MADDLLLQALYGDLNARAANNPWLQGGKTMLAEKPRYYGMTSPWAGAASSFAQALLGSAMQAYGGQQEQAERSRLTQALLDAASQEDAAAALKANPELSQYAPYAAYERALKARALADKKAEAEMEYGFKSRLQGQEEAAQMARLQAELKARFPNAGKLPLPTMDEPTIDENGPNLAQGRETPVSKIKRLTVEFINSGQTPAQAAMTARDQVRGETAANAKSFDQAKKAREKAQQLSELVQTAEAGVEMAGSTGKPWQGAAHLANVLGIGEDSNLKVKGDTLLDSIGPTIVQMSRSPGAVSDYETRMYLKAGPSTKNTPEANRELIGKMKTLAEMEANYADFLEAYRDQNFGSTNGADRLWLQYKKANPLFVKVKNGEVAVNSKVQPWQEYFSGQSTTQDRTSSDVIPKVGQSFNGQKVVSVRKVQ